MASAGDDGAIVEAEAGVPRTNRRRISDYLADSDGGDDASPPPPDTPPQLRLPRFTCVRLRFVRLGRKRGDGRKEAAAADKGEDASAGSSGSSKQEAGTAVAGSSEQAAGSTSSSSVATGQTGVGLSMLLLLAARACVELNRIAEVRAQMEALLTEVRDEASRMKGADHVVAVTPKPPGDPPSTSSTTASSSCISGTSPDGVQIARGEDEGRTPPEDAVEAEPGTGPTERRRSLLDCNERDDTDDQPRSECSSVQPSSWSDGESFIELEGGRFGGSARAGVVGDDDGESCGERDGGGGVSAIELERRLHELRHRRDRERIEELESALRRADRMLTEKEMEARLWQDTAALALGQPPRGGGG